MLEDHERAAMMINEGNVTWHQFVQARFVNRQSNRKGHTSLSIDVQTVSQESHSHAALRGLLEYSTDSSLPIVFEFIGALDLDTRDVRIDDGHGNNPERSYEGRLSENGRVLTLRSRMPGKTQAKPLHLVHEGTVQELFYD